MSLGYLCVVWDASKQYWATRANEKNGNNHYLIISFFIISIETPATNCPSDCAVDIPILIRCIHRVVTVSFLNAIRWTAFFSVCEFKVRTRISNHQI